MDNDEGGAMLAHDLSLFRPRAGAARGAARFVLALGLANLAFPVQAQCPCSLWSNSATPGTPSASDTNAVELGVRFSASQAGRITGLRFYKGAANTGTHVGNLWRADGTLLASAAFANESATGWQSVSFASPVNITAGSDYVASYHAPNGGYAGDNDFFATQGVTNGPLSAPAGTNGVYVYGATSAFPTSSYRSTNYWVDVLFEPIGPAAAPVLLVTSAAQPFTSYLGEILRAEGLNHFASVELSTLTAASLAPHDVVVLGHMPLTATQVTVLSAWVNTGGQLIAMRPDKQLAGLLGLSDENATLSDGYLRVDTAMAPGRGIVGQTMQYHDAADLYALDGAQAIATLYSNATTPAGRPAVVWRQVGANGGRAAAFVYDLARSVVYTRQGNPAWAEQERDNIPAIRANDMFFPDWVNLDKVAIPQADEQQRLLANLILTMNLEKKPLPRFWYLPDGLKAALVHALDDHLTANATQQTFDKLAAQSPAGCSVADWKCLRATAWVYTGIPVSDSQAAAFAAQGFELGVHAQNGCTVNFTSFQQLDAAYKNDLQAFQSAYPSLAPQTTSRFHCIVWSDWVTQAKVQRANGIRFNLDYYYYPGSWIQGRSGLFTGSGLPMRFADLDGTPIDVYQGVSQLVNENDLPYPATTLALLDRALGPEGYYGLFGTHDDYRDTAFLDGIIAAARSRNVPIISAQQALTWLDGRNASSFENLSWSANALRFDVSAAPAARNLQALLPFESKSHSLSALTRDGQAVTYATQVIKGLTYAAFAANSGAYVATYDGPLLPPPAGGLTLWPATTTPAVASFPDNQAVELGVKFQGDSNGRVLGLRFYKGAANTGTHVGSLWSATGTLLASAVFAGESASGWQEVAFSTPVNIVAGQTYVASYFAPNGNYAADGNYFASEYVRAPLRAPASSAAGGNGVYKYGGGFPDETYDATNYWVDVVFSPPAPPVSLWTPDTTPAIAAFADNAAVELGVKFDTQRSGEIVGVRFYKGATNTGTHVGNLWSATGTLLASVTFTGESSTGWQEARFATPVSVVAGQTYVASYFAPNGNYAADSNYFASEYVRAPLRAPASSAAGGNGVYKYGGGFPDATFNATNYWVDVLFLATTP
jgi:hypothetical protein